MLDIFVYNENMCFVNISFNLINNITDFFDNNNFFFENFYFSINF